MAAIGTNWFCANPTPSAEIVGDYAEFIVGKCERCQEGTPMDVDKKDPKRKDRSPTPPAAGGKDKEKEKGKGKERGKEKRRKGVSGVAGTGKGRKGRR